MHLQLTFIDVTSYVVKYDRLMLRLLKATSNPHTLLLKVYCDIRVNSEQVVLSPQNALTQHVPLPISPVNWPIHYVPQEQCCCNPESNLSQPRHTDSCPLKSTEHKRADAEIGNNSISAIKLI